MTIYNSITELVGKTPVIKLNSIVPEGSADVYVKQLHEPVPKTARKQIRIRT